MQVKSLMLRPSNRNCNERVNYAEYVGRTSHKMSHPTSTDCVPVRPLEKGGRKELRSISGPRINKADSARQTGAADHESGKVRVARVKEELALSREDRAGNLQYR